MCDHGHSHDHGGCAGEVVDINGTVPEGIRYDMWRHADMDKVTILNEESSGSAAAILKEWDERADKSRWCETDADEELLINIPFSGQVRITGLCVIGEEGEQHPARIRLFKDREGMSFDSTSIEADQEIDLKQDVAGVVDYPLKASKFNSLSHLSLHIDRNFGADTTKVYHIGLRGEYLQDFRSKIVIATYESRAIPKDHKGEIPDAKTFDIS